MKVYVDGAELKIKSETLVFILTRGGGSDGFREL